MHDVQHPADIPAVNTLQIGNDGQIFPRGQVQVAGGRFDQAAGLPQQRNTAFLVHGLSQQRHAAAGGMHKPQQHLHCGGFSRPVGA